MKRVAITEEAAEDFRAIKSKTWRIDFSSKWRLL